MLTKLKADKISAMKEKNTTKKTILGVIIGEIERENKNKNILTNDDIIKRIKKLVDNNIITNNTEENIYLECYLPKMLTNDELEIIISNVISDNNLSGIRSIGVLMKHLNENYSGQFDGKNASIIAKGILM